MPLLLSESLRQGRDLPQAVQALRNHRTNQLAESLKQAWLCQDHGLVFTTQVGTPLNRHNAFRRSFKLLLRRAGLPDTPFHSPRHSFAALMLSVGGHPEVVQ